MDLFPEWVDAKDIKIYTQVSGKYRPKYRVVCYTCGKDRGYKLLQNCKTHPNCNECAKNKDASRSAAFLRQYRATHTVWNKGKTLSQETKLKIGLASTNRNFSLSKKEEIKQKKQTTFALKYGFSGLEEFQAIVHLKRNLRSRLNKAISGNYVTCSAISDLGCSIKEFKTYLETMFYPDVATGEFMSWSNYGSWHIDHIRPLVLACDEIQLKGLCHYTNLQPLWAKDNLDKRFTDGTFEQI